MYCCSRLRRRHHALRHNTTKSRAFEHHGSNNWFHENKKTGPRDCHSSHHNAFVAIHNVLDLYSSRRTLREKRSFRRQWRCACLSHILSWKLFLSATKLLYIFFNASVYERNCVQDGAAAQTATPLSSIFACASKIFSRKMSIMTTKYQL